MGAHFDDQAFPLEAVIRARALAMELALTELSSGIGWDRSTLPRKMRLGVLTVDDFVACADFLAVAVDVVIVGAARDGSDARAVVAARLARGLVDAGLPLSSRRLALRVGWARSTAARKLLHGTRPLWTADLALLARLAGTTARDVCYGGSAAALAAGRCA